MSSRFDGDGLVKVIELTRGDRFYFSCKYDLDVAVTSMGLIRPIHDRVSATPAADKVFEQIKELEKKGLWGTAVIEGNPVKEEDGVSFFSESSPTVAANAAEDELVNIRNAYELLDVLQLDDDQPVLLSEKIIKEFHRTLTDGLPATFNTPGKYRDLSQYPDVHDFTVSNKETGGVYKPPKLKEDVSLLMKEFVAWINSEKLLGLDPIIRAGLAHYHLALIHPFWDGNGRTARLVEAYLLHCAGIKYAPKMISINYYKYISYYYQAFRECEKNKKKEVEAFLVMYFACLSACLVEIWALIAGDYERMALKSKIEDMLGERVINKRQHNVIIALQKDGETISVRSAKEKFPISIIYDGVSSDTVRRDLNKLVELGLLSKEEREYSLAKSERLQRIEDAQSEYLTFFE